MTTRIVETVTGTEMSVLRQRRDAVVDADIVELRLDGVRDLDVAGAVRDRNRPVIVTCRASWEGGAFDGDEASRRRIIQEAVSLGAEYVDVERRAEWRPDVRSSNTALVLSDHQFDGVPADLHARVLAMRRERPGLVKIAAMAQSASDCLLLRAAAGDEPGTIVIGMGGFGRITRALPSRFGSCWTYGGAAAPGQYAARDLATTFRVRDVTESTRVFAVTGNPLDHSASPAMHNAAFQAMDEDAVYVPLQAVNIADAVRVIDVLGLVGVSVTAPLKQGWTVEMDDEASKTLGAVNTLKRVGANWQGRNVDGAGFLDACDARQIDLASKRVVILGSGGAARAVGFALVGRGALVTICARRATDASALAAAIGADTSPWPAVGEWDMLVNATPCGTWPNVTANPVRDARVHATLVYDLVYNPEDTALLREARARGAVTIGGLEMLVGQAVRQSQWWTGRTPPAHVMTEAARAWIAAGNLRNSSQGER